MAGSVYEVTCPNCGAGFSPPATAFRFFCPQCGMQIASKPATLSPEEAQAQAMRAVEQAARASQMAMAAAKMAEQSNGRNVSVEEANRAVQQAMEAMRMAQEAQRAQEQHAQAQQEEIARQNAELERQRQAMEAEHRRQNEAAKREAEELARRQAEERARLAEEERRKAEEARRQAAAQQAQQTSQPQEVEYRRGVAVRHTNGCGLYVVTLPTDWRITETAIKQSSKRRYNPDVMFKGANGAHMRLMLGDAGTRLSSGMQALMNQYGGAIAGVDTTNYASMPNAITLADNRIIASVKEVGASDLHFVRDVPSTDLAARQQDAYQAFKAFGSVQGNTLIKDPYAAEVLRVYEFMMNGVLMRGGIYVRVYATKDASGVENFSPVGLMFNAGSALGGLFGSKKRQRQEAQRTQQHPATSTSGTPWCVPDYESYVQGGTIYWDVCGIATLYSGADTFEEVLNTAFIPFVRSYKFHSDILNMANADARQEAMMMQQATNRQISAMNMQTQATLARAREASAASTARVNDYLRQSDAHHQAFRERTNAQFNTSYGGGSTPDYSEAIRGVNTFMTSDGREVELDVSADRAYENQAGDVIGGSGGFDPGADWNEIPRV